MDDSSQQTALLRRPVNLRHYVKWLLGVEPAFTQTSLAERECLRRHAEGKRLIAEVGTFEGVNSRMFRSVMATDGLLILVDPYERRLMGTLGFGWIRRIAHREVGAVPRGSVMWLETTGEDAAADPRVKAIGPIDMVFIDGDHTYAGVQGDWLGWSPLVRPGGIIALHDSVNCKEPLPESETFTQDVVKHSAGFAVVEEVDTLTIVRKL